MPRLERLRRAAEISSPRPLDLDWHVQNKALLEYFCPNLGFVEQSCTNNAELLPGLPNRRRDLRYGRGGAIPQLAKLIFSPEDSFAISIGQNWVRIVNEPVCRLHNV
jgi:hypothetical protein